MSSSSDNVRTYRPLYRECIGRNPGEEYGHSHLYQQDDNGDLTPMCRYGWNRSDGAGFSVFRGHRGSKGLCNICHKRSQKGLPPVPAKPGSHKTKWM